MLSDIVRSGTCQKLRITTGGTTAMEAMMTHWVKDVAPSAMARRNTPTTQQVNNTVLTFSDGMTGV